jgi:transposase-like protein
VILVVLAALSDGRKVVLLVSSGYRESTQSWSEVLRDLKERGMNPPRLVIADGHLGSVAQGLPRSRRAEMLESSHRQFTA